MSLFNSGDFTLHSGKKSNFLIDCTALTDDDLNALAKIVSKNITFNSVMAIPSGGLRFAFALAPYIDSKASRNLIVDDVYTTGGSMEKMKKKVGGDPIGVVIFARTKPNWWVKALFECHISEALS